MSASEPFIRLTEALPRMEAWIRGLHAAHASRAQPVSCLGFGRLAEVWPHELLEEARAVSVERVPYPPVSDFGLPELEPMAQERWSGITFGHMYFVDQDDTTEATHFHELCHVVQWRALGVRDFLMTYALGLLEHGYRESPLEAIAYRLQGAFEAGLTQRDLVDVVAAHAWSERVRALGT
jgi:hypothetical protein